MKEEKKSFKGYKIDKIKMNKLLDYLRETKEKTNFNVNHKTRPIIFKKGLFIGGYDDLIESFKN